MYSGETIFCSFSYGFVLLLMTSRFRRSHFFVPSQIIHIKASAFSRLRQTEKIVLSCLFLNIHTDSLSSKGIFYSIVSTANWLKFIVFCIVNLTLRFFLFTNYENLTSNNFKKNK